MANDGTPKRAGGQGLGEIDSTLPSPGAFPYEPAPVTVTEPGAPLGHDPRGGVEFVTKGAFRPTPDFADHVGKPVKLSKWTRKRIALTALGAFGGLLLIAVVLILVFWSAIARWAVHRAANARGVELEEKGVSLGPSNASVTEIEARFPKVKGIVVRAKKAEAELSFFSPESVRIGALEIEADYPQSVMGLGALVTTGSASDLPLRIDGARVVVKKVAPSLPIGFEFAAEKVTHKGKRTDLLGITATVPLIDYTLGPFDVALLKSGQGVELTTPSLPMAKFLLDAPAKHLTISVSPQPLAFLRAFGADKKAPPSLGGDVGISIPDASDTLVGTLDATLANFAIPQLEGILPGDLKITGEAIVTPGQVTLDKLKLTQGALTLTGKGKLVVLGLRAELDLEGGLPCSGIAGDVLASKFGVPGIGLLGGLIGGSITVKIHAEAGPPTFIPSLKVEPTIGCKLGGG